MFWALPHQPNPISSSEKSWLTPSQGLLWAPMSHDDSPPLLHSWQEGLRGCLDAWGWPWRRSSSSQADDWVGRRPRLWGWWTMLWPRMRRATPPTTGPEPWPRRSCPRCDCSSARVGLSHWGHGRGGQGAGASHATQDPFPQIYKINCLWWFCLHSAI